MILRRPYAFLIKHFRLIHIIITALLGYVLIKTRGIYKYIITVINDSVNRYNALDYIDYSIYIFMIIAISLCFIVYWLLKFKDKPRRAYKFTIVGYILIGIFLFVLYSYMNGFSNNFIEQRIIRLYRDIFLIVIVFQYFSIAFMLIRGLGFDIKKFNFSKDAQELNLNSSDSEEIEIDTQIDTSNALRILRKQGREFGYFFQEYKLYIIIVIIIVLLITGYKSYNYFNKKLKVYKENEIFGNIYKININNSYYNLSEENNNYIIIDLGISKLGNIERLNPNNIVLMIGKKEYLPNKNICYKFTSFGSCYKKQYITNNNENYILVYPVEETNIKKAYIQYNETYDNSYKVKLSLKKVGE